MAAAGGGAEVTLTFYQTPASQVIHTSHGRFEIFGFASESTATYADDGGETASDILRHWSAHLVRPTAPTSALRFLASKLEARFRDSEATVRVITVSGRFGNKLDTPVDLYLVASETPAMVLGNPRTRLVLAECFPVGLEGAVGGFDGDYADEDDEALRPAPAGADASKKSEAGEDAAAAAAALFALEAADAELPLAADPLHVALAEAEVARAEAAAFTARGIKQREENGALHDAETAQLEAEARGAAFFEDEELEREGNRRDIVAAQESQEVAEREAAAADLSYARAQNLQLVLALEHARAECEAADAAAELAARVAHHELDVREEAHEDAAAGLLALSGADIFAARLDERGIASAAAISVAATASAAAIAAALRLTASEDLLRHRLASFARSEGAVRRLQRTALDLCASIERLEADQHVQHSAHVRLRRAINHTEFLLEDAEQRVRLDNMRTRSGRGATWAQFFDPKYFDGYFGATHDSSSGGSKSSGSVESSSSSGNSSFSGYSCSSASSASSLLAPSSVSSESETDEAGDPFPAISDQLVRLSVTYLDNGATVVHNISLSQHLGFDPMVLLIAGSDIRGLIDVDRSAPDAVLLDLPASVARGVAFMLVWVPDAAYIAYESFDGGVLTKSDGSPAEYFPSEYELPDFGCSADELTNTVNDSNVWNPINPKEAYAVDISDGMAMEDALLKLECCEIFGALKRVMALFERHVHPAYAIATGPDYSARQSFRMLEGLVLDRSSSWRLRAPLPDGRAAPGSANSAPARALFRCCLAWFYRKLTSDELLSGAKVTLYDSLLENGGADKFDAANLYQPLMLTEDGNVRVKTGITNDPVFTRMAGLHHKRCIPPDIIHLIYEGASPGLAIPRSCYGIEKGVHHLVSLWRFAWQ